MLNTTPLRLELYVEDYCLCLVVPTSFDFGSFSVTLNIHTMDNVCLSLGLFFAQSKSHFKIPLRRIRIYIMLRSPDSGRDEKLVLLNSRVTNNEHET